MDVGNDRFAVFSDLLYDADLNLMLDYYYEDSDDLFMITGEDGISPLILLRLTPEQVQRVHTLISTGKLKLEKK